MPSHTGGAVSSLGAVLTHWGSCLQLSLHLVWQQIKVLPYNSRELLWDWVLSSVHTAVPNAVRGSDPTVLSPLHPSGYQLPTLYKHQRDSKLSAHTSHGTGNWKCSPTSNLLTCLPWCSEEGQRCAVTAIGCFWRPM